MSEELLKPCPFCGNKDITVFNNVRYDDNDIATVVCCLGDYSKEDAIAAWNRRVNQSGWVKASERLPADKEKVQIYTYGEIEIGWYEHDNKLWCMNGDGITLAIDVTHWAELSINSPPEDDKL